MVCWKKENRHFVKWSLQKNWDTKTKVRWRRVLQLTWDQHHGQSHWTGTLTLKKCPLLFFSQHHYVHRWRHIQSPNINSWNITSALHLLYNYDMSHKKCNKITLFRVNMFSCLIKNQSGVFLWKNTSPSGLRKDVNGCLLVLSLLTLTAPLVSWTRCRSCGLQPQQPKQSNPPLNKMDIVSPT